MATSTSKVKVLKIEETVFGVFNALGCRYALSIMARMPYSSSGRIAWRGLGLTQRG
jgi:hypothetical protein